VEVSGQLHVLITLPSAKETSLLIEWDVGNAWERKKSLCPCQESIHVSSVPIRNWGAGGGRCVIESGRKFTFHKTEGYRNGIVLYLGLCFVYILNFKAYFELLTSVSF